MDSRRPDAVTDHPALGLRVDELDTPALCIDIEALDRNIARIAGHCRQQGIAWRPHAKGHKSPVIARRQLAAGAIGVTCAKLGEAEVMCQAGVGEALVANQIAGPKKIARLVALRRHADAIVAVDHIDQVVPIDEAMRAAGLRQRVLIEVDIGLNRAGVAPGEPTVRLAREITGRSGVALAGIMGYEGHLLTVADRAEKGDRIRAALAELVATRAALEQDGIACDIVSAGGTGSYEFTAGAPGITELQAGGLIFMDAFYRHTCQVSEFEYALTVATTVVGRPARERAISDAGRKSVHGDLHAPLVMGRDDIQVGRLSAEHGELKLAAGSHDLRIGDRLALVPGYGDFTCVLHDEYFVTRNGIVEAVWPIAARGRIR